MSTINVEVPGSHMNQWRPDTALRAHLESKNGRTCGINVEYLAVRRTVTTRYSSQRAHLESEQGGLSPHP
jgi:hypothetical protein